MLIVHGRIGPLRVGDALSKGARGELVKVFSTMPLRGFVVCLPCVVVVVDHLVAKRSKALYTRAVSERFGRLSCFPSRLREMSSPCRDAGAGKGDGAGGVSSDCQQQQ